MAGSGDFASLDAAMTVLSGSELTRGAAHAAQLRGVLRLADACTAAGWEIAVVSQIALALGCSEHRAARLLSESRALSVLPGALEAVECGLLTVEQSGTVLEQLPVLDPAGQVAVWRRLQTRLIDAADGTVAPPARLAETLRRWVHAYDRDAAVRRRREAEQSRKLDYRRRSDGLVDLFGCGLTGPDAHAILSRIAARSRPWGSQDDRTADQRRLDAFRDLLLGRDSLPIVPEDTPLPLDGGCAGVGQTCPRCLLRAAGAAPCGCLPGQPAPCGADVAVLLPIGAGLGTTDEVAELVGHGPLEPDLLEQLLRAAPRLRPVWVDDTGVPVAVGDRTIQVERGDAAAVRAALLALQALPPPPPQPRHPLDHSPPAPPAAPSTRPPPDSDRVTARPSRAAALVAARPVLPGAHPPGAHGAYRPSRRLRRLVTLRAPRCEWPGCGARAVRCDLDHDRAWTGDDAGGPTCACNLGPCCRRHHRIKQLGWTKTRDRRSGVTWTHPAGRRWNSPSQHEPPAAALRPPPPLPSPNPLDELNPDDLDEELWHLDLLPDDPGPWVLPADIEPADIEPADYDELGHRLSHTDTCWTLDLADPCAWQPTGSLV